MNQPAEIAWWKGAVSTFPSAKNARPTQRLATWEALCASLTAFRPASESPYLCTAFGCYGSRPPLDDGQCPKCGGDTSAKIGTKCWSPASYPPGVNRSRDRVIEVSCLVLDYDDGTTLRQAHEQWAEWPHIMHTSWSHTPEHHKCRVVVPLLAPVPADGWARVFHWAATRAPSIDTKCSDPSRIYFLPSHPEGQEAHRFAKAWHAEGRGFLDLDPSDLPETPEEKRARQPRPRVCWAQSDTAIRRELQEQLKVDPASREQLGLRVGGALYGGAKPRIDKIPCPQCGRHSVCFYLHPVPKATAWCAHEKSCNWMGWLDQLLP